ncbi:unnamed protein product [Brassica oleracea var. botrytis]|uniref:(rape) hypothetical protein n=1 Tax=Brassica napus TaxID=3708 RepID=A0A816IED1_BRANA|nr:unnamed protein product [Brassica napus]
MQEKAEQWTESAKEIVHSARDKTANAAQSTKESAQHGQQQVSGFIQQTGESVKNMAQGAVDSVKNTLGINEKKMRSQYIYIYFSYLCIPYLLKSF